MRKTKILILLERDSTETVFPNRRIDTEPGGEPEVGFDSTGAH
jgi:hypothetical protein